MLLAHFSDVHVTSDPLGWRRRDYFNKRLSGLINLQLLGRGRHFGNATQVLTTLTADIGEQRPDRLVFSGDATGLGFPNELAVASRILTPDSVGQIPGLAVPGNHDYYTPAAVRSGDFEKHFNNWQQGQRVDGHRYPFAQKVGGYWLVAINSSTANRGVIDASGAVGREQLERLETLLTLLSPEPRIVVTHYPLCLANGRPEKRFHGLRDLPELLGVLRNRGICLWLHGHRHHAYRLQNPPGADFPVICAGSATQHGRASYGLYDISGSRLQGRRREFNPERGAFQDVEQFELRLGP